MYSQLKPPASSRGRSPLGFAYVHITTILIRVCFRHAGILRRMNYQSYFWLYADDKRPDLPDWEESGWDVGTDGIEYKWMSGAIVPQDLTG